MTVTDGLNRGKYVHQLRFNGMYIPGTEIPKVMIDFPECFRLIFTITEIGKLQMLASMGMKERQCSIRIIGKNTAPGR